MHKRSDPYRKKDVQTIENVQKRATKLITKNKHLPYKDRLRHSPFGSSNSGLQMYEGDMRDTYTIFNNIYDLDVLPYLEPCSMRNGTTVKKFNEQYSTI